MTNLLMLDLSELIAHQLTPQVAGQYICRHALHRGIAPGERRDPFAASCVEYFAPAACEADDHPRAPLDPIHGRLAAVTEQHLRHELRIFIGEKSIVERHRGAFLL